MSAHGEPASQQAAVDCELAPSEFRSGTSGRRRTRLSKAGNAGLRKALHLPALTAFRFNPLLKAALRAARRRRQGAEAAVGACMRTLLIIASGMLKDRTPFDPSWASKSAP